MRTRGPGKKNSTHCCVLFPFVPIEPPNLSRFNDFEWIQRAFGPPRTWDLIFK